MSGNSLEARFEAIIGATGTGKTTRLRNRLGKKKRPRIMCFSPKEKKDRYADWLPNAVVCTSIAKVLAIVRKAGERGKFCIVFVPTLNRKADEAAFDVFCRIALAAENLTVIVEELHTVTRASWSVDGWRKLNFMGRASGCEVFGLAQRPASVDKDFMGSLSFASCSRLAHDDDRKAMAKVLGTSEEELNALIGYRYIQRDMVTGKVSSL